MREERTLTVSICRWPEKRRTDRRGLIVRSICVQRGRTTRRLLFAKSLCFDFFCHKFRTCAHILPLYHLPAAVNSPRLSGQFISLTLIHSLQSIILISSVFRKLANNTFTLERKGDEIKSSLGIIASLSVCLKHRPKLRVMGQW